VNNPADRLLLRLASRFVSPRDREWILGDLEEEHTHLAGISGKWAGRRWLIREAARLALDSARNRKPALKGRHPMRNVGQDVLYAIRLLRHSPGFTCTAVLTLALGIGAVTAIFSIVDGVLMKPLPYAQPDSLVRVFEEGPNAPEFPVSPATFLEFRSTSSAFAVLAAYERGDLQLGGERPEQLRGMRVSAGFFDLLGYRLSLGREFARSEEVAGQGNVVVLSHAIWKRRFGSDTAIVGQTITLSGRAFEVIGVLPPGVQHVGGRYRSYPHGESVDVWWPRALPTTPQRQDRGQHYLNVVGRLRSDVTFDQARDDLRRISGRMAEQYPDTNARWSSHLRLLRDDIIGTSRSALLTLLIAAAAVLLIACLNVAGLLLGRATTRVREIGVRSALGATRARLLRQLAIESCLLAALGGLLGVVAAPIAVDALLAFAPPDTPRVHMVSVNRTVLAFTLLATVFTALLFGLAPAIQLARANPAPALQGGRGAPGGAQQRLRRGLVVAEVALAFALVVTGGLLLRSFDSLLKIDPGFRPERVLTAMISLPPARYREPAQAQAFFDQLIERIRSLPGVEAAGAGSDLPWTGYDENTSFRIVGRQFPPGDGPEARYHFLTPGFIGAIGLPLLAGRDISALDTADTPPVVLINEATARKFWGEPEAALNARLNLWSKEPTSVVGVIGDVKDVPWADAQPGGVYFPQAQQPSQQGMFVTVRVNGDPRLLADPLIRVVQSLDPELPVAAVRTLDDIAGGAFSTRRFVLGLVAAFGATALFLAVVGVYGVMAQAVGQRIREFGVRQAVGAEPGDILRLVLSGGALLGIAGLAAGMAITIPATALARSMLFRTSPSDPLTLSAVASLLLFATLAASYLPARAAMRADPAAALRQD
jgi:predicted permease